jgi:hypothetical protein
MDAEYVAACLEVDTWRKEKSFDGKLLEEFGFRLKAKVYRTAKESDHEALRTAVRDLKLRRTQMPTKYTNLGYYLSHHVLQRRFTAKEALYILERVVAAQNSTDSIESSVPVQMNDQEDAEYANASGGVESEPDFDWEELDVNEEAIALELMEQFKLQAH